MATTSEPQTDGRFQRSERSREAIVQALLELVGEGVLEPTAQQVAERAAVGVRTVFRHFSDMDTLFAAMNEHLILRAETHLVDSPQTGRLAERIAGLVEHRSKLFAVIEPFRRAQALQRWRSPFLQEQHQLMIRVQRRDLELWLPEIAGADAEIAEALELALSFESWDRLRSDQRLGLKKTQAVLSRLVQTLARELSA